MCICLFVCKCVCVPDTKLLCTISFTASGTVYAHKPDVCLYGNHEDDIYAAVCTFVLPFCFRFGSHVEFVCVHSFKALTASTPKLVNSVKCVAVALIKKINLSNGSFPFALKHARVALCMAVIYIGLTGLYSVGLHFIGPI